MTITSTAEFVKRINAAGKAMDPKMLEKRLGRLGSKLKPIGPATAAADLGSDSAFSGWRNGGIPLQLAYKTDGGMLLMHRSGRSAGPWRVAEQGRNQGNAGGGMAFGPGILRSGSNAGTTAFRTRKNGDFILDKEGRRQVKKVREFKRKRWNGYTQGKGTWSKTEVALESSARRLFPTVVTKPTRDGVVDAILGK
jgi:hypothetical protein